MMDNRKLGLKDLKKGVPVIQHPDGNGRRLAVAILVGSLALAAPVTALQPAGELAAVSVSSAGVDFWPEVEYARAILTVSGGGTVSRHSFESGEPPSISVFGSEGNVLPDGVYKWELELQATPAERRELMLESTKTGGQPAVRGKQSGWFAIVDGFVADPNLAENDSKEALEWEGFGSYAEPAAEELGASELSATDLDSVSDTCEARSSRRMTSCEVEALANPGEATVDPMVGGLVVPDRVGGMGDSDADVAAAGLGAGADLLTSADDPSELNPPRRTFDPEGANGRPRSETDQQ